MNMNKNISLFSEQKGNKEIKNKIINKTIETVKLDLGGQRSPNCGVVPSKYIIPNQHNNSFNEESVNDSN